MLLRFVILQNLPACQFVHLVPFLKADIAQMPKSLVIRSHMYILPRLCIVFLPEALGAGLCLVSGS